MVETAEMLLFKEAAARIAGGLLQQEGVQSVLLTEVPPKAGGFLYRLLVVVDDQRADKYLQRCVSPLTVTDQGGERDETLHEIVWSLLEVDEDAFFDEIEDASDHSLRTLWGDGELDIVLVSENWEDDVDQFAALERECDDGIMRQIFTVEEWFYAALHRRVYDPSSNTF